MWRVSDCSLTREVRLYGAIMAELSSFAWSLLQRRRDHAEWIDEGPHGNRKVNGDVLLDPQQPKESHRRNDAEFADVDLPGADQHQVAIHVAKNRSLQRDLSLYASYAQNAVHSNSWNDPRALDGIVAQHEGDRRVSRCAKGLEKIRILESDSAIERTNRDFEGGLSHCGNSVLTRSGILFECRLSAYEHLSSGAGEIRDVRCSGEPDVVWG